MYLQIAGAILIIVGALAQTSFRVGPLHEAIFIIIIGGIIFILAFFGCCGAIKENRCMLITVRMHTNYCLLIIIIVIIVIVIVIIINHHHLHLVAQK